MTSAQARTMKRLRQRKIWPSVVMFILFLVISLMVISSFFFLYILGVLQSNYANSFSLNSRLVSTIEQMTAGGREWDEVMQYVEAASITDSAAIVDDELRPVVSYGELTYNQSKNSFIDISTVLGAIYEFEDNNSSQLVLPDTSTIKTGQGDAETLAIDIPVEQIMYAAMTQNSQNSAEWLTEELCSITYWIYSSIKGSDYHLVTKNSIVVRHSDVTLLITICRVSFILLCIPIIALLISIIKNIFSQKTMRTLLFTDSVTGGKSWLYVQQNEKAYLSGTGLLSWLGFKRADNRTVAVVDLELQKYRSYCTCHGEDAGQQLLEKIDKRINTMIYKHEVCARTERSDFCLILRGKDEIELRNRVYELTQKVTAAIEVHHLTWHAGIYIPDRGETDISRMYNYAAAARASLKTTDKTGVVMFDKKMLEDQLWEHTVEDRMEKALENEEFEVYLQPKYDPVTEKLSGAEALIRWISPEDGFISPGRFIPIFEKNGFITKIDDYMLAHAAAQQAKWIAEGKPIVPISVNISRAHFAQPNLAEHIRSLVDRYGIPHSAIEIELTESAFFDDKNVLLNTVQKLKEYGFDISMDDFGAGYSSLNSLKDLPLDVLKLDAEFFRGNAEKERSETVVSEAIKLAKSLDMRIVAEGVEKKEQVDFLAKQGCDMIQGFYFAKPMPISEFEQKHWAS